MMHQARKRVARALTPPVKLFNRLRYACEFVVIGLVMVVPLAVSDAARGAVNTQLSGAVQGTLNGAAGVDQASGFPRVAPGTPRALRIRSSTAARAGRARRWPAPIRPGAAARARSGMSGTRR